MIASASPGPSTSRPSTTPSSSVPRLAVASLAGRAGHTFDPATMLQGFACHGRGVELCEATPKRVRARVRSKRVHDVELQARSGRLIVACSCPARSFGQTVCKHVWATLLEVDRKGGLEDLHAVRGMLHVDATTLSASAPPNDVLASTMTKAREPREKASGAAATSTPVSSKPKRETKAASADAKTKPAKKPTTTQKSAVKGQAKR